jgi:transposase
MLSLASLLKHLVPRAPGVQLSHVALTDTTTTVNLVSVQGSAACPRCGTPTTRVHSRYTRMLADLPWARLPIQLHLTVRKFRCPVSTCPQQIFTEQLPTLAPRYVPENIATTISNVIRRFYRMPVSTQEVEEITQVQAETKEDA